jgi:hypothetical protein
MLPDRMRSLQTGVMVKSFSGKTPAGTGMAGGIRHHRPLDK